MPPLSFLEEAPHEMTPNSSATVHRKRRIYRRVRRDSGKECLPAPRIKNPRQDDHEAWGEFL